MAGGPDVVGQPGTSRPGGPTPGPSRRALASVATSVIRRPDLWWTALGALRRLAAPGWWSTPPHLPVPDTGLWEFRMVMAYGQPYAVPTREDVISYLEWCRATARRPVRRGGAETARSPAGRLDPTRSG